MVADAVFDGHRLAREIDSEDPASHLPFVREIRVLGLREEDYDGVVRPSSGDYVPSSRLAGFTIGASAR